MNTNQLEVHELTPGCKFVHNGKEGVLVGCICEAVKYLMLAKLTHIKLLGIVLSDTAISDGYNYWSIEFPYYKGRFIDGQGDLSIVGTEDQLERAKSIMQLTLLGPTNADRKRWSRVHKGSKWRLERQETVRDHFAVKDDSGRVLELEELVNFQAFASGSTQVGPFCVTKEGSQNHFSVTLESGECMDVTLDFAKKPTAPYKILVASVPPQEAKFAVHVLTYGNGFDPSGGCTSFVVWINGIPFLWDAAPFVSDYLDGYGLSVGDLGGVFLSHVHEDHCNILELMERTAEPIRLFTTAEVYESLIVKLAALLNIPLEEREQIESRFDWVPLDINESSTKHLLGASVYVHQCVHTIPTFGIRLCLESGDKTHEVLIGSDSTGPEKLQELREAGAISDAWFEQMMNLVRPTDDLVILDGGSDPGKLHPNPGSAYYQELVERATGTVVFGHTSKLPVEADKVTLAQAGSGYVVAAGKPKDQLVLGWFLERLGVADRHAAGALWYQSEIREASIGEVIVAKGQTPTHFYLVTSGTLQVEDGDKILAELHRGDFFGEVALLEQSSRTATVRSAGAARLIAIPARAFGNLVESYNLTERFRDIYHGRRILASVELFRDLPVSVALELADCVREVDFGPKTEVVQEGAAGDDCLYVLMSGEVEITRDGNSIARLNGHTVFGESAVVQIGTARNASVTTVTACSMLRINGDKVRQLQARFYTLRSRLQLLLEVRAPKAA